MFESSSVSETGPLPDGSVMSLRAHLSALATRQCCDVTEVCDAAQLACHGHHASLFAVLLTCGHVETHHHRLLVIFPVK